MVLMLILCFVRALPEAFKLNELAETPRCHSGRKRPEAWTGKWNLNPNYDLAI